MALTESQLQQRIAAIRAARDSGVQSVRHGDTQTIWRSLADVNEIIASLENQLAKLQGRKRSRVNYITQTSKGY